jgi:hypothetical protein
VWQRAAYCFNSRPLPIARLVPNFPLPRRRSLGIIETLIARVDGPLSRLIRVVHCEIVVRCAFDEC